MKAVRTLVVAAVVLSLSVGSISASQVGLSVEMSNPVLKALKKQTTFLKVGLTGFKMQSRAERAPVNISLVLDKSGSMKGSPMEEARSGAIEAIRRLGPNDIVSVITYDSTVHVLVPATKLTDKDTVCRQISQIRAGGGTALFAGVSKGAAEIRKFADRNYVNRVILLSDGKANIGPSSPSELGDLGASFKKENMTVSTMGLGPGYNEDLMLMLASRSGGN
ncbi:MAG: VWA domain-containing protein, partial [Planctomycetaceae bacterium]